MKQPKALKRRPMKDLKLDIKSSIPQVRNLLGLFVALWRINPNQSKIAYSMREDTGIVVEPGVFTSLSKYFENEISLRGSNEDYLIEVINENPLFKSQIEHLQVALELIWRLGRVDFTGGMAYNVERSGGIRYPKILHFSANLDLLNLLFEMNEEAFKKIIFNWMTKPSNIEFDRALEDKLIKFFTVLSEPTTMKLNGVALQQEGIYSAIENEGDTVDFTQSVEKRGATRIFARALKENMQFYLELDQSSLKKRRDISIEELNSYRNRVNTLLDISNINSNQYVSTNEDSNEIVDSDESSNYLGPHNLIVFGSPGTGKSYTINNQKELFGNNYERVTFHPNYTFSQFVGSYRPKPIYKEHEQSHRYSNIKPSSEEITISSEDEMYNNLYPIRNEPFITYEFVPGPFLKTLVSALKEEKIGGSNRFLLIIEEINRANVASVFGDIFQLLDRENGTSQYPISIPEDMRDYLLQEGLDLTELYLPSNFYIRATMNSADQGVQPMDSAFKRRWSFEYVDVNQGEHAIEDIKVNLVGLGTIRWNTLRKTINAKLIELEVKDDKLLGPFFLNEDELSSDDKFKLAFKNKVLLYLFDDVFKHTKRGNFFVNEAKSFSTAINLVNSGKYIFGFGLEELTELDANLNSDEDLDNNSEDVVED